MKYKKGRKRAAFGLMLTIVLTAMAGLKVGSFLPIVGDHNSPANSYVANYYIIHALEDTNSPNIVTAVLADYRGFDTLFETCVLFLAGLVVMTILPPQISPEQRKRLVKVDNHSFGGTVLDSSFRLVVPVIMIYGIYVLFHGEVSLGGGFQAGALLACAYLLDRIIPSFDNRLGVLWEEKAVVLAGIGTFFYAFTGMLPMFCGGKFLEFGKLPFGIFLREGTVQLHSAGILMVELGVTLCVMAIIISILEVVLERTDFEEWRKSE